MATSPNAGFWSSVSGLTEWLYDSTSNLFTPRQDNAGYSIGSQDYRALVNGYLPPGVFLVARGGTALASSTAETSLFTGATLSGATAISGTVPSGGTAGTFPAGSLNVAGKVIRVRASGVLGNTGTPDLTVKLYYGSTALGTATGTMATITTTKAWTLNMDLVVTATGATGTVKGDGKFVYNTSAIAGVTWDIENSGGSTVDLTAAGAFTIKGTWSASSSSNTIANICTVVEILN